MLKSIKKQESAFKLPFFVEQDEDNVRVAESPIFDGCVTQWHDLNELKDNIEDVSNMYFDMIKDWEQVLKWKNIVYINFDKHGKITDAITQKSYLDLRKEVIHLA